MKQDGKIRIIGGMWKRTSLPVLDFEGLRPTGDRQREMIFNWLNHLYDGDFSGKTSLDMFGGTGALSFEFISRGGQRAVIVEKNKKAASVIKDSIKKLNTEAIDVICGDSLMQDFSEEPKKPDLIFIDPPFSLNLQKRALLKASQLINDNGFIYVESPDEIDDAYLASINLAPIKRAKTGPNHLLLTSKEG